MRLKSKKLPLYFMLGLLGACVVLMGSSSPEPANRSGGYVPVVVTTTGSTNSLALAMDVHGPAVDRFASLPVYYLVPGHKYRFRVDWNTKAHSPTTVKWYARVYWDANDPVGQPYDPGTGLTDHPGDYDGNGKHEGRFGLAADLSAGSFVILQAIINDDYDNMSDKQTQSVILFGDNAGHTPVPPQDGGQPPSGVQVPPPPIVQAPPPPRPQEDLDAVYAPIVITTPSGAGASGPAARRRRLRTGPVPLRQMAVFAGDEQEFTVGWGGDNLGLSHDAFPPGDVELKAVLFRNGRRTNENPGTIIENPSIHDAWHHVGTVLFTRKTKGNEFILVYGLVNGEHNRRILEHSMAVIVE